jgi:hypothetical protein
MRARIPNSEFRIPNSHRRKRRDIVGQWPVELVVGSCESSPGLLNASPGPIIICRVFSCAMTCTFGKAFVYVVVVFALRIGVNSAMFALVDHVLLRDVAYADPARLG